MTVADPSVPGGTDPGEAGQDEDDLSFHRDLGGWPGVLTRLLGGVDLAPQEAGCVLGQVLRGEASDAQVAAFAIALRAKGETVGEMTGLVRAMIRHAEPLPLSVPGDVVDTCGTGGDRSASVNASTMAALVVAGAGVPVCKHGGRAATSAAGSADVLEALGVVIDLDAAGVARCVAEAGMGFCFAPRFHPAMRHAIPVRRELGVPTLFNFLGPLANPARARLQVVGVSDPRMAPKMLGVLAANGARRAMVVHGADGLDELSPTGPNEVLVHDVEVDGPQPTGPPRRVTVDPQALGLGPASVADLRGGDTATNAEAVRRVLGGERGPQRDFVVLNAAAALVVAAAADDMAHGVALAEQVIDDGRAEAALDRLVAVSQAARAN